MPTLMPHGNLKLSGSSDLSTGQRSWLLSFVGSAYRPNEPEAYLTIERYSVVKRLLETAVGYEKDGSMALKSARLRQCVEQLHNVNKGLQVDDGFFIAPITRIPRVIADATTSRWRSKMTMFYRRIYTASDGSLWAMSPTTMIIP
eukprot:TRINITY_DN11746_c0_g1_i1.p1 TRINITY_DN11746_c0_g1~~TRINITY_DN11746_c0_g1_i1.p1  ORF type:complete len:145 (+),score=16.83 TRINITY_DN11746_c0_g1_i1:698-1132(+)